MELRKCLTGFCIAVIISVFSGVFCPWGVELSIAADPDSEEKTDPRMLEVKAVARIRDYGKMFQLLKPVADDGEPDAMFQISGLYRTGKGVKKDVRLAYQWMKKAAEKGYKKAVVGLEAMEKKGWHKPIVSEKDADKVKRAWFLVAGDRLKNNEDNGSVNLQQNGKPAEDTFRWAARKGQIENVRLYVEGGVDVDDVGPNGRTALIEAAGFAHAEVVEYLLQRKARHDMRDRYDNDPLLALMHNGKSEKLSETLTHLIDYGADINSLDANGNTALLIASGRGLEKAVSTLLDHNASIGIRNKKGRTAVQLADLRGHKNTTKILLRHGAVLEKTGEVKERKPVLLAEDLQTPPPIKKIAVKEIVPIKGWSTLMIASWYGNEKVVSALLAKGIELDWQDEEGHTALSRAAWQGNDKIVAQLLAAGAKADIKQRNGMTALSWASRQGKLSSVRHLIKAGARVNLRHNDGNSPVFVAVAGKHLQVVATLLSGGAKCNIKNKDGWTPLLVAVRNGQAEMVESLLEKGADVHVVGPGGQTVIWYAAESGNAESVKMLVAKKVDVNHADIEGQPPLFVAAAKGHIEAIKILLKAGASAAKKSKLGNTPLMTAAMNGHHQVVTLLAGEYPDVDQKNSSGDTALILAVAAGHLQTAEVLLEVGAGPYKKNSRKQSALLLAEGNKDMLEMIESYGLKGKLKRIFSSSGT